MSSGNDRYMQIAAMAINAFDHIFEEFGVRRITYSYDKETDRMNINLGQNGFDLGDICVFNVNGDWEAKIRFSALLTENTLEEETLLQEDGDRILINF